MTQYAPAESPPSPTRAARMVDVSREEPPSMLLWFGPMGPNDIVDHIFDMTEWVGAAPDDSLLAASAAYGPQVAPGEPWHLAPAPARINGATVIVRLSPAGAYPPSTTLTLGCTVRTAQGRTRAVPAFVSISEYA